MPHKGHDNKPTRKPQRIFRGQDGTTVRLTDISRCGASKCHMLRHCGRPKTTIAALFLFLFPFPFYHSPAPIPRSLLFCSCHFYSYLLALAIPCCFSIIYAIDISTPSFRTVFGRLRLRQPPTALAHTSIYSCNQLGTGSVRLAVDFIYCLRFAKSLPRPELRSSSFQMR